MYCQVKKTLISNINLLNKSILLQKVKFCIKFLKIIIFIKLYRLTTINIGDSPIIF